ncbi:MAG: Hsp33 family molecular chaperone HslO [Pseudomonadales bacterium]|nr:Hsp33 family molecular chaperone HslO [Pseudomonadales bacterium]
MLKDSIQRFLFQKLDIRGQWVHLDMSYQEILGIHPYPEAVARLLGEFLAASALLGSTLKFQGRLVLQVRSSGEVSLLMAEVTHDRQLRGIARMADVVLSQEFNTLLKEATLVVSVEPKDGERYQSLVPLSGANLAECLVQYFDQSEQLQTFIKLTSSDDSVAGILLQQLPKQLALDESERESQWQHAMMLAKTLKQEELLILSSEKLLQGLFADDAIKLLEAESVVFKCSCNSERTANALMMVGPTELESMFEETPEIEMACEFCHRKYCFTRESLGETLRKDKLNH